MLFILLFKNSDDDPARNNFDKYYMPLAEIKDFDQPMKTNRKRMKKLLKCQKTTIAQQ